MKVTIGADPEMFLKNKDGYVSAHGVIPGTKLMPHEVLHGAVQVDGMALEININPAKSSDEFVHNIEDVLATLQKMLPTEHTIDIVPEVAFKASYFEAQPEVATRLGCDPDFDAYRETVNPAPSPYDIGTARFAGGHIHVGWTQDTDPFDEEHFSACCQLARQLDYYIGIPSLLYDNSNTRRKFYGRAGTFRPKTYGMEYRVLSNFWLKNKTFMKWVYDVTKLAVDDLADRNKDVFLQYGGNAKNIINGNRQEYVKEYIGITGVCLPNV